MNKLTLEEREFVGDMMTSLAWPALLKLIENLVENQSSKVLTYNLDSGKDNLVIEKARFEGAQRLQVAIAALKKQYKAG